MKRQPGKQQVHTWRTLVELDLSGEPGSEQLVAEHVAEAMRSLDWSAAHMERLRLALIRALVNAIERSRVVDSEGAPVIRVLLPEGSLPEHLADQAWVESTPPPSGKAQIQQSRQAPIHGWGFFLIERTVQGPGCREMQHFIELFLYPEGEKRDSKEG
jgi:anti-sigma regulatory factor (Ser/Thr protein kinase)